MQKGRLLTSLITIFAGVLFKAGMCMAEPDQFFETPKISDFHFRPAVWVGKYVAGELIHNDRHYLYVGCTESGIMRRYILSGTEVDAERVAAIATEREIIVEGHLPGSGYSSFFYIIEFSENCGIEAGKEIPSSTIPFNSIIEKSEHLNKKTTKSIKLTGNDKELTPINLTLSIGLIPKIEKNEEDQTTQKDSIGNIYIDETCKPGKTSYQKTRNLVRKALNTKPDTTKNINDIALYLTRSINRSKSRKCSNGKIIVHFSEITPFEL